MIITVTLNAAIDRTVAVPNFHQGHRHRSVESRTVAGGKGINVARALARLGRPVIAAGLAGGPTGQRLIEELAGEGIVQDLTPIAEESRINLAVIDPTSGEQTEINERGPEVSEDEVGIFLDRLDYLARGARICVLAGSLPPGVDPDLYARIVRELRQREVIVILDSDGEPMRAGLRAGPSIVAPNVLEAEELVGHEFSGPADLAAGLAQLLELGAEEAVITLPEGCVAAVGPPGDRSFYSVSTPSLEPVAAVGSGDAFIAGYVAARYDGAAAEDCLAYGVACGAESTQHFGAGGVDPEQVERIRAGVELQELEVPAEVA
jgi:1-phosphofructokinase/tagatose 6-phosphate kinase